MCTLVLAHRVVADLPLIVLANRDEFLDRPALPPGLIRSGPDVFGGLDEQAGGTWLGVNQHGLLVGLTNLAGTLPDPSRRSRGLLVMDLLTLRSAAEVHDALSRIGRDACNPFRVIASDGIDALRARYDGAVALENLSPGVHAATNWREGSAGQDKRSRAEARVRDALASAPEPAKLAGKLTLVGAHHDSDGDPHHSLCCHAPGYSTRSSSIVLIGPSVAHWSHAEGPPCRTPYDDRSVAFRRVLHRP